MAQFIKNRTNTSGSLAPLVFDKVHGYDSLRSSIKYAKDIGMLGGNKNGYYFVNNKDMKFTNINAHKEFAANRELYKIMYAHIVPTLETCLSKIEPEDMEVIDEQMD